MKKKDLEQPTLFGKRFIGLVVVACLICAVFWVPYLATSPESIAPDAPTTPTSPVKNLFIVTQGFISSGEGGNLWKLQTESVENGLAEQAYLAQTKADIRAALDRNRDLPEVAEMKAMFEKDMFTSIFVKNKGAAKIVTLAGQKPEPPKPGALELCAYPMDAQHHSKFEHGTLFYDHEWGAVIFPALHFPDQAWFDAVMIHEIYHAYLHKMKRASSLAKARSDLWISEEIECHELENKVLDKATGGKYLQKIASLVSRSKTRDLEEFLETLTQDDLKSLDSLFRPGYRLEKDLRGAQYSAALAFAWVKANKPEQPHGAIDAYKYVVSVVSKSN